MSYLTTLIYGIYGVFMIITERVSLYISPKHWLCRFGPVFFRVNVKSVEILSGSGGEKPATSPGFPLSARDRRPE